MISIPIKLTETSGVARIQDPIKFGVALKCGEVFDELTLALEQDASSELVPYQLHPLAKWEDGSIRWLLVEFEANVGANNTVHYRLVEANNPMGVSIHKNAGEDLIGTQVDLKDASITVYDANPIFNVDTKSGSTLGDNALLCYLSGADQNGSELSINVDNVETTKDSGPFRKSINLSGHFLQKSRPLMSFSCRISGYATQNLVKIDFTIHNQNAAKHDKGMWDLGDAGSVYFSELAVKLVLPGMSKLALDTGDSPDGCVAGGESLEIYQGSSGGENWDSTNHVNRAGELNVALKGYQLEVDGELQQAGNRASPILSAETALGDVSVYLEYFWQNFPSALSGSENGFTINLFPARFSDIFELQPGEKKTQSIHLRIGNDGAAMESQKDPLIPVLDPQYWVSTGTFPFITDLNVDHPLRPLLDKSLDEHTGFFAKREMADQYGWRNFGELFADHESLYLESPDIFVSHYNNQYDAINGFLVQYLVTGDTRWYKLMEDLAKHVIDIDIYDTDKDRIEFNGALFWHTNHYMPAGTATHRTHSKAQFKEGERLSGGGPSAEHAYISGLVNYYFLTGDEAARDAATKLVKWIINYHDGSQGLLNQLHSIKKFEINKLVQVLSKTSPFPYKYPLTRATGNYVRALIDGYKLTNDRYYLDKIAEVIANTLHPADNIGMRRIGNTERNWSYVVMLTAIAAYLAIKERLDDFDHSYHYAKASFLHYTDWMLENEVTYMSRIEVLLLPNDTWVAQEIRKCNLFIIAAQYDHEKESRYLERANYFFDYVVNTLSNSEELHLARIQVILLQNFGIQGQLIGKLKRKQFNSEQTIDFGAAPVTSIRGVLKVVMKKVMVGVCNLSPREELFWLRTRTNKHVK